MAGQRVAALAEELEKAQAEFERIVAGADEERLRAEPLEGEWNAAHIVGHVTEMQPFWTRRAVSLTQRFPQPISRSFEDLAARNQAVELAGLRPKQQLLTTLRRSNRVTLDLVRGLTDEQLDASGPGWDGRLVTVESVIRNRVLAHVRDHVDQLGKALEAGAVVGEV